MNTYNKHMRQAYFAGVTTLFFGMAQAQPLSAQQVDKYAYDYTQHHCSGNYRNEYVPQWPHDTAGFAAMSQILGKNMEGAAQKATQKAHHPIHFRWNNSPNLYRSFIENQNDRTFIMAYLQGHKSYMAACNLK